MLGVAIVYTFIIPLSYNHITTNLLILRVVMYFTAILWLIFLELKDIINKK
jgi:hypothetical protein